MASSSTNPYPNYPYPSEFNVSDYPYPSEFNVSDLVPDKLSKSNYSEWKPLMLDFIESQDMDRFIHHPPEESKLPDSYLSTRSDRLVRRWILSTLNKDIIKQVLHHKTAREVWKALETKFGPLKAQHDWLSYMEIDRRLGNYMPLHINAIQGDIQSAKEFIYDEPEAIRMPISTEGETMLITAIRSVQRNKLVAYLLGNLSAEDLTQRDNLGRTALHEAAEVGNLEAAKMLVKHNPNLPYIEDNNGQIPLLYAAKTGNREMVRFVLDCVKRSGVLEAGRVPPTILYHLANSGLYDIALELLQENSMLECTDTSMSTGSETCPLMAMSQKRSSFRSGTPLSSFQKFIYSIAPAKLRNNATTNPAVNENRQNPPAVTDTENSIVDENPQSGAVNPVVNENQQNPLAVAENSIVNENTQNAAVNPAVNENRQNPPAVTDTENSVVDENLQSGAVNPVVNENQQNPLAVTEKSIDNEDVQNGRWHATHWHLADQYVPAIKHIREIKLKHDEALELVKCLCKEIAKLDYSTVAWMFAPALEKATSSGIHEIVEEILRSCPDAIYLKNENNQSIFQSAIVWRRENVFNLIYQLKECSHKFLSVPDKFGNNALHLAGCLGPQHHLSVRVSAAVAALQMQRELQWFKEVEKFVLPEDKECRNDDGMTPAEVFTKTHKELAEAGERWMKETATSCTIVTALIATVMFAAAITVPGGNNASSGVPIFSKQKAFIIFGLSNALALFASITSLLMFLFILTAHYAEQDFLYSLPNRLIRGLVYLFLSISSTVTAFSATLYLMMGENRPWIIYPIVAFAYIPMHLCFSLLFPLLVAMYKSTYRPAIFGKQSDHMLF